MGLRSIAALLWVLCCAAPPAQAQSRRYESGPFADSALQPLLARMASAESDPVPFMPWGRLGIPDPQQVLFGERAPGGGPVSLQGAIERVHEAFHLEAPAARAFLAARLYLATPRWNQGVSDEAATNALEAHRLAAKLSSGNIAVLASLAGASLKLSNTPGYDYAMAEVLDLSPSLDPALELARAHFLDWGSEFSAYVVSRDPSALSRALEAFGMGGTDETATLFYLATLRARSKPTGAALPKGLAERLIRNLFETNRPALALDVLRGLPRAEREALLRRPPEDDLRIDVAAAWVRSGNLTAAREWFDAPRRDNSEASSNSAGDDLRASLLLERMLVERRIHPQPTDDAFDLISLTNERRRWVAPIQAEVLSSQYPHRVRNLLKGELAWRQHALEHLETGRLRPRLTFLNAAAEELKAADAEEVSLLRDGLARWFRNEAAKSQPTPLDARLSSPPLRVFEEVRLERIRKDPRPRWTVLDESEVSLPPGFSFVRAERHLRQVVALATSSQLDPTEETRGGGYWLLLSSDRGEHWDSPRYTGLRVKRPHTLARASSVALVAGGNLRLQVAESALLLVAPLQALSRDTDGDGFTDVTEDRLLLDPRSADTDSDGLPDGTDPLPLVPRQIGEPTPRRELVREVLLALFASRTPPAPALWQPPSPATWGIPSSGAVRLPPPARVLFVELESASVGTIELDSQAVVLTPAEMEKAYLRFGRFYPVSIQVELDQTLTRAFITWSELHSGASSRARRVNGAWKVELLRNWMSCN